MAVRRAVVTSLSSRNNPVPAVLGQLIDDGVTEPYGTTPMVDEMLRADRRDRFNRYYLGYSNGYTFQTQPEVARSNPAVWEQFLEWARGAGRETDQAGKVAKLDQMIAAG